MSRWALPASSCALPALCGTSIEEPRVTIIASTPADRRDLRKPNKTSELKRIAERYATFAADEASGSSEIYERLALAVAGVAAARGLRSVPSCEFSASPATARP